MKNLYLPLLATFIATVPGTAQQVTRRANITGNAVDGKCTIEVSVDGAAEVEVRGNQGRMRNLSGRVPVWLRFDCNGTLPAYPHDFRFRGIDGRGTVQLIRDPRTNRGRVVFRIDDPKGGPEGYTVDLEWRGSNGQFDNRDTRGWRGPNSRYDDRRGSDSPGDYRDRRYYDEFGRWNADGASRAIEVCQADVEERIQREGFGKVTFSNVVPDNNPGRNDFVDGFAAARRGWWSGANFQFSCSVNLANGRVRSVDLQRLSR